ncbi:IclR family transcriptional regulator domain-containing protein [Streptomyces xanthophaeus]
MSRYDGHRGECPEPAVPAGLTDLLAQIAGTPDFWDRPQGDWGLGLPQVSAPARREERANANSFYRLGSKALRRGELATAADLLGQATEHDHPGAFFRLAVVAHRQLGSAGRVEVRFLVAEAARLGHGDALALQAELKAEAVGGAGLGPVTVQDPEFTDEVRAALGLPHTLRAVLSLPRPRPSGTAVPPTVSDGHSKAAASEANETRTRGRTFSDQAAPTQTAGAAMTGVHSEAAVPEPTVPVCDAFMPVGHAAPAAGPPLGHSHRWSPNPLRSASLTHIGQQTPPRDPSVKQWESALRVLDVLHTISGVGRPISTEHIHQATSLPRKPLQQLLVWLCEQGLIASTGDGGYIPGPVLTMISGQESLTPKEVLSQALDGLRDAVDAAVYVATYTNGEVTITEQAVGPTAPGVREWIDFRESAHASAVGKSLLAQLDFDRRMDHLSRRQPRPLTPRTITDRRVLFRALDGHGPQAPQFDILEYSNEEVCVAFHLGVRGQAGCVALSLPVTQRHRLFDAAKILSSRSSSLLLSILLAESPPAQESGRQGDTARSDTTHTTSAPTEAHHSSQDPTTPMTSDVTKECAAAPGRSAALATPQEQQATPVAQGPEPDPALGFIWPDHTDLYLPPYFEAPTPHTRHLSNSRG